MTERLYRAAAFMFGASAAGLVLTVAVHFLGRRVPDLNARWPR
jgi:hypothetical protein